MAEAKLRGSSLRLVFDYGMDEKGKPVYKTKTFSNIRLEATPDQLSQAANALGSLSEKPLVRVERSDQLDIL
jgi:hypothetical protein